ncbi:ankyrin repeat domain-containing protein [Microbispora hainanensis]|uniref:ankyrin repeat domain-containing protein n=1 Tax=Microbispora TaxID=2005 RepID=UPI001158EA17|nr:MULTISPECIES: ankyrin repeat domain-containing protein [Microbispora]NJP27842.1 ankyrin repeat domain-containing protein [Microbispora sp. CL1-1]TQS10609.1 ankyrin repeat domain-containing protein [Microbispora sp. SCL1-1]
MAAAREADWSGIGWDAWKNLRLIRARLDAGADPDAADFYFGPPLHRAAEWGSPGVVAELAARVDDVDAEHEGRTALWTAVFADRPDNARILAEAGADPWRPMMNGWSPGRLSLATPTPGLFGDLGGRPRLTDAEAAAVQEAGRLIAAVGGFPDDGLSVACVAGITAAEVVRRLGAGPEAVDPEALMEDPWMDLDDSLAVVGVTDVPGGCVVSQPWGYTPSTPGVTERLSVGTVCYAMFANPKSGNQGSVARDGEIVEWDTHPGGGDPSPENPAEEILRRYLFNRHAVAYCCAGAGIRPTDAGPIAGQPDTWVRLPDRDYWG